MLEFLTAIFIHPGAVPPFYLFLELEHKNESY